MFDRSHIELAYSSIKVFADDGKLDLEELNYLMGVALADGQITDDEKRVLGNIFKRVNEKNASRVVLDRIAELRKLHHI